MTSIDHFRKFRLQLFDNFQISRILGVDFEKTCDIFDELSPGWRDVGIPATAVFAYSEMFGITCVCFHENRLIQKYTPPEGSHKRSLCFNVLGSHAFFYRGFKRCLDHQPSLLPSCFSVHQGFLNGTDKRDACITSFSMLQYYIIRNGVLSTQNYTPQQ